VLPGESGQIDYAKLLRLVHAADYNGDINVEVSGQVWSQKSYDPIAAAKKSYTHMAAAFKDSGIKRNFKKGKS
jgi:sugar phosphate isomerase/epimerase